MFQGHTEPRVFQMRGDPGKAVPRRTGTLLGKGLHKGRADGVVNEMDQGRLHFGDEIAEFDCRSLWGDLGVGSTFRRLGTK